MDKNLISLFLFAVLMIPLAGCTPTPEPDWECGDGPARAVAWEDLNLNGVHDKSEPPLEGVCILTNTDSGDLNLLMEKCKAGDPAEMFTDNKGVWMSRGFVVGACGTSKEVDKLLAERYARFSFYALAPRGYVATTESEVFGCDAEFGFAKDFQITPTASEATPAHDLREKEKLEPKKFVQP